MFESCLAIFILIFLTSLLDVYVIRNGDVVTVTIILFYLSHEGTALLKNISKLGLPFPEVLCSTLERMKGDGART
ncbi:MAG: phage holin family protein [Marvinbryantia sp.]|uniref:phage holin family protein n=1 Tax=Marvinbryantia sp. TaxID=2496532 RepID=UPI00399A755F